MLCFPQRVQHTDAHFQMDLLTQCKGQRSESDWQAGPWDHKKKLRKKAKEDKKNKEKPFCLVDGNQTHDPELIRTSLSLFSPTACPSELSVLLYDSSSLSLSHSFILSSCLFLLEVLFLSCFCLLSTGFFLSGIWWPSEEVKSPLCVYLFNFNYLYITQSHIYSFIIRI